MKVALINTKINRHTGKVIGKEIKEIKTVNEDEFYRPLVEVLGNDFLRKFEKWGMKNNEAKQLYTS